jgi:hypothetical protein
MPLGPLLTRLTMCQDGTEIGAATAVCAQPANVATAAASSATRRTLTLICFQPFNRPVSHHYRLRDAHPGHRFLVTAW